MSTTSLPDFLSHYYEAAHGPFRNLSDLPPAEAEAIMERIRQAGESFASRRAADYLAIRRDLEDLVRQRFVAKGGRPRRMRPHYMILGACPWLLSWYRARAGRSDILRRSCGTDLSPSPQRRELEGGEALANSQGGGCENN